MAKEKKEEYYGEPIQHDPAFSGPIHNNRRSCTDIICLLGFIVFLCLWLGVGIYAMKEGSFAKLLAPIDSEGGRCGVDSQLEDKKYLVFFNIAKCLLPSTEIVKTCSTPQVCVNKCPEKTIVFNLMNENTFTEFKSSMVCTYDVNVHSLSYDQAVQNIDNGKCASYVIKSSEVFGRCFVDITEALEIKEIKDLKQNATEIIDKITDFTKQMSFVAQVVQELVKVRWYMLSALVAVVLVCFIYILVLRWVLRPLVWTSITLLFVSLAIAIYLCTKNYIYYRDNDNGDRRTPYKDPTFWLILVIVGSITTIILILVVIFLRSRINLAIEMIKEGSKAVFAIKSTVYFPIFPWILQCSVIVYGVAVIMLLLSISEEKNDCECPDYEFDSHSVARTAFQHTTCLSVTYPTIVPFFQFVNIIAFFWTTFFIAGLGDMILANCFSTWYWTFKKSNLPFFALSSSIFTTLRYHMGTVAFGSLILAIIRLIRIFATLVKNRMHGRRCNLIAIIICIILKYCLRIMENLFKFISKNAYIMCTIHGTNFCSSARIAYSLLMRNIIRVYVLDKVIEFIFFLSKAIITIGIGFGFFYIIQSTNGGKLEYTIVPTIIIALATYLICSIFFNVYAIAVDTLFLCFLEDCERNDGSPEKPYFMSKNLMKILGKENLKDNNE